MNAESLLHHLVAHAATDLRRLPDGSYAVAFIVDAQVADALLHFGDDDGEPDDHGEECGDDEPDADGEDGADDMPWPTGSTAPRAEIEDLKSEGEA